jgi:hypothetical protein
MAEEAAERVGKQIPRGLTSPHKAQKRRFAGDPVRPRGMTKIKDLYGTAEAVPFQNIVPSDFFRKL